MKKAFVTYYQTYEKSSNISGLFIYNGFSFIYHLLDGEHFFVKEDDNIEILRDKLRCFDKIFISVTYSTQIIHMAPIVDKRFVFGGKIFEGACGNSWFDIISSATIHQGSFEKYLGVETSNIFTPYWNKTLVPDKYIQYNAIIQSSCYWSKCLFCSYSINSVANMYNIRRNVKNVLLDLPVYDNCYSLIVLNTGAILPQVLEEILSTKRHKNTTFFMYVRADKAILDVIRKCDDLSNIYLGVGIEVFSQKGLELLNKNTKWNVIREFLKETTDRGAFVKGFLLDGIPFTDNEMVEDSINNIKWLAENVRPSSHFTKAGLTFNRGTIVEWPSLEAGNKCGPCKQMSVDGYKDRFRVWPSMGKIVSDVPTEVEYRNNYIRNELKKHFFVLE